MFICDTVRILGQAKDGHAAFRECEESDCIVFFKYLDVNHEVFPLATISWMFGCCVPRSLCKAQKKIPPVDHDYYVLAMSSIADITAEASKLPDIPQRVKVLIEAAKILQPIKKEEAVRLLELVLRDLNEWGSADTASWRQRNTAATLRNEALAVYALADSEKALVRQKEFHALEESTAENNTTAAHLKSFNSWRAHFSDKQAVADHLAKLHSRCSSESSRWNCLKRALLSC